MPNLKEEIVKRLEEFPGYVVEGKTFREYLDDLAEDIQADVIRALRNSPYLHASLAQPNDPLVSMLLGIINQAGAHKVEELTNDAFGATVHNLVFLSPHRPEGLPTKPIVQAMLRAFVEETLGR